MKKLSAPRWVLLEVFCFTFLSTCSFMPINYSIEEMATRTTEAYRVDMTVHPISTKPPDNHHLPIQTITPTSFETGNVQFVLERCSPLQGVPLEQLSDYIHNPYHPPPPGRDDPHQGVDFAIQQFEIAVSGNPVQSVFEGFVALVLSDRFPYGNAIMIETPIQSHYTLPENLNSILMPAPTIEPHSSLNCPEISYKPAWNNASRSLYLLYAHLAESANLKINDYIGCGEVIGNIGDSGNALNPHLHLEIRAGPGGARFESMAHYDTSASPDEMGNYCIWRVTNLFQLMDPMEILVP